MLEDHHKRYLIITGATIVLALFILTNKMDEIHSTKEDLKITKYDEKNNSLMELADDKIKRIQEIQMYKQNDQHELEQLLGRKDNKVLEDQIEKLRNKLKSYDTQLLTLNDVTPLKVQPKLIRYDSIAYNVIHKDTVIYDIIRKDTVICDDTVYINDTVYVDPKFIKSKFYKQ